MNGVGPSAVLVIALSNAVLAAAMALLLLPAARLLRRPAVRHAICVLVLLKLLTPPLWRIDLPGTPVPVTAAPAAPIPGDVWMDGPIVLATADRSRPVNFDELRVPPPLPVPMHAGLVARAAVVVWIGGSLACLTIIVVRIANLRRLLGAADLAPAAVQDRTTALARRLGRSSWPGVWFVQGGLCPMLVALWRTPRVFVPRALWDTLDDAQRDALLLHELAHYRRRDHWVRWVELAATVLYWWHPAVWWVRRELRESEEQCCDAWVVWATPGSVRAYLTALMDAIDFGCASRNGGDTGAGARMPVPIPALASGMGQFSHLKRRITMIQQGKTQKALTWRGFVLVCALGGILLPVAAGLGQAPPDLNSDADASTPSLGPPAQSPGDEPAVAAVSRPQLAVTFHDYHRLAGQTQCASCHGGAATVAHVAAAEADATTTASTTRWRSEAAARAAEVAKLRDELARTRARLADLERRTWGARNAPGDPYLQSRPARGQSRQPAAQPSGSGTMGPAMSQLAGGSFIPEGRPQTTPAETRPTQPASRAPPGAARGEREKLSALEKDVRALLERIQSAKDAHDSRDARNSDSTPPQPSAAKN